MDVVDGLLADVEQSLAAPAAPRRRARPPRGARAGWAAPAAWLAAASAASAASAAPVGDTLLALDALLSATPIPTPPPNSAPSPSAAPTPEGGRRRSATRSRALAHSNIAAAKDLVRRRRDTLRGGAPPASAAPDAAGDDVAAWWAAIQAALGAGAAGAPDYVALSAAALGVLEAAARRSPERRAALVAIAEVVDDYLQLSEEANALAGGARADKRRAVEQRLLDVFRRVVDSMPPLPSAARAQADRALAFCSDYALSLRALTAALLPLDRPAVAAASARLDGLRLALSPFLRAAARPDLEIRADAAADALAAAAAALRAAATEYDALGLPFPGDHTAAASVRAAALDLARFVSSLRDAFPPSPAR